MASKKKKRPVGRPRLFDSPEQLEKLIKAYFKDCDSHTIKVVDRDGTERHEPDPLIPTIAGLAYAIGVDRMTVYNYAERDEYFSTIKAAREYILSRIESGIMNCNAQVAGKIFIAKNYGYTDTYINENHNHNYDKELDEIKKAALEQPDDEE
jgi:hypothetical protein